jgi:hypothetical protein
MKAFLQEAKLALVPWFCDPTDVAGCIYWLRASVGVETLGPEGRVKTWTDQVAHLPVGPVNQATAPVHLDFVAELNGKPGIGFYSQTQMLHKVGGVPLPWEEAPFSLFAFCDADNAPEVTSVLAMWAGTAPHAGLAFTTSGELRGFLEEDFGSNTKPEQYRPHVIGMTYNGLGTLKLYVDGEQVASHGGLYVSAQDGGNASILAIGGHANGSEGFRGHLGDLAIYNRALDDDDVRFLTKALDAHYGSLPWWYRIFSTVVGAGRGFLNLLGEEVRHLLGDATGGGRSDG